MRELAQLNPYSVSTQSSLEKGVFSECATLHRRSFLYREIQFEKPFQGTFVYNGWWFRQVITLNAVPCWFRISWLRIHSRFEFELPEELTPAGDLYSAAESSQTVHGEIEFSRTLAIRRFRVWLGEQVIYDEIR